MKDFWEALNSKQNWARPLLVLGVVGICFMLLSTWWPGEKSKAVYETREGEKAVTSLSSAKDENSEQIRTGIDLEENRIEQQVKSILQNIAGIGEVDVCISLATSSCYEYATNLKNDERKITEKDNQGGVRTTSEVTKDEEIVLLQGNSGVRGGPLVVQEIKPEINGVLVVAEGAFDARVREELIETIQTVLNVPPYKIKVMPKSEGR